MFGSTLSPSAAVRTGMRVHLPSNSGSKLTCPGCRWVTTTNATPQSGGTREKNVSSAWRPPADAPIPAMRNGLVAPVARGTAADPIGDCSGDFARELLPRAALFLSGATFAFFIDTVCFQETVPDSTVLRQPVSDLGKGRVALKPANSRFVCATPEAVALKAFDGVPPGDGESFQWIHLMRGDTRLRSLVYHRYLPTKPNEPRPVTATATGPPPARKGGKCFKWTTVE